MRAVLIGCNGQLGRSVAATWPGELEGLTHEQIEVTDRASVLGAIERLRPQLVINTAAFHDVDRCESEVDRAFAVNAIGVAHLADACREQDAALMHISTDYVFDGTATTPYCEDDAVCPRNVYGLSKAAGEQLIRTRLRAHYIVRTSGLYGIGGSGGTKTNFVERMLQRARQGVDVNVVDDQVLSPTSAGDLAAKLPEIAAAPHGTYHVTNSGSCSWFEFAKTILTLTATPARLAATTSAAFAAPAARPAYSVLANSALIAAGIAPLRPWPDALADYLAIREHL